MGRKNSFGVIKDCFLSDGAAFSEDFYGFGFLSKN